MSFIGNEENADFVLIQDFRSTSLFHVTLSSSSEGSTTTEIKALACGAHLPWRAARECRFAPKKQGFSKPFLLRISRIF